MLRSRAGGTKRADKRRGKSVGKIGGDGMVMMRPVQGCKWNVLALGDLCVCDRILHQSTNGEFQLAGAIEPAISGE